MFIILLIALIEQKYNKNLIDSVYLYQNLLNGI